MTKQKAAIAVDMLPLLEAEARERQLGSLKQNSTVTQKIGERAQAKHDGEATDQAAKLMGTNRQYVSDMKKIKQEAPEVFNFMDHKVLKVIKKFLSRYAQL